MKTSAKYGIFIGVLILASGTVLPDWVPEKRLSKDIWNSTTSPSNQCHIAVEKTGNIHVVWLDDRDHSGTLSEVYYRKYTKALKWGSEARLTFDVMTLDPEGNPVVQEQDKAAAGIVADAQGNLYVSFENKSTKAPQVLRRDAKAGTWDTLPTKLGTGGLADINVVLAADSGSNIHAVWRGLAAGKPQIFYRQYVSGSGWSGATQLTTASSQKQTPALTVDASGNTYVVWADSRNAAAPLKYEIYAKKRSSTGSWGADTRLSFAPASDSLKPYITASPSGDLHLAWEDDRHGNFEIYYRFKPASSGTWGTETRLTNNRPPPKTPISASIPWDRFTSYGRTAVIWGGWAGTSTPSTIKRKPPPGEATGGWPGRDAAAPSPQIPPPTSISPTPPIF